MLGSVEVNPNTVLAPLTWEMIDAGKILVGHGVVTDSSGNVVFDSDTTVGEYNVRMTIDTMPSHTHTVSRKNASTGKDYYDYRGSGTYPGSAPEGGSGAHTNVMPYVAYQIWKCTYEGVVLSSLSWSPTSVEIGGSSTLTAVASGGIAPFEYKFTVLREYSDGSYSTQTREWGTSNSVTVVMEKEGSCEVGVLVRDSTGAVSKQYVSPTLISGVLIGTLEETPWDMISQVAREGRASQYWKVGDTKTIDYNGISTKVRIADLDGQPITESQATNVQKTPGIVFEFTDIIPCLGPDTSYASTSMNYYMAPWHSSNQGAYLEGDFLGKLPSALVSVIRPVYKYHYYYDKLYAATASYSEVVAMTVFIASYKEYTGVDHVSGSGAKDTILSRYTSISDLDRLSPTIEEFSTLTNTAYEVTREAYSQLSGSYTLPIHLMVRASSSTLTGIWKDGTSGGPAPYANSYNFYIRPMFFV